MKWRKFKIVPRYDDLQYICPRLVIASMQNIQRNIIGFLSLIFIGLIILTTSCKKEDFLEDQTVDLRFSQDTLMFDTIFTTIGSSTQYLIVTNPEKQKIRISNIRLAGGSNSNFRINVDGQSGTSFKDIEIASEDSIYIFVEVTVDPNGGNSPMIITDSITFETNGNLQDVDLVAFGRDAYFIVGNKNLGSLKYKIVAGENVDTTWTKNKPIVVYGYAVVDSTGSLTIEAGTEVFFHSKSGLWIYKGGQLKVLGTKSEPVIFQGDRTETYYDDLPGQWDRIWINESDVQSEINYAIIRNAFIGLQTEILQDVMASNKLVLKNTIIENMSGAGILSRYYSIDAENILITNCQQYCTALTLGGEYEFRHSTFANYWSYNTRKSPTLYINNYFQDDNKIVHPFDLVKANFINCIVYGNLAEEVILDNNSQGGQFNFLFDHGLVKTEGSVSDPNNWKSVIKNQDPLFEDKDKNNYHLKTNSAAADKGKSGISPLLDLDENTRDASTPDLGAYEIQ